MTEAQDKLVPFYRRQARRIDIAVEDHGGEDTWALIMVRVVFQRGGGKHYYVLKRIEHIQSFYPKEMGQDVVNAILTAWAEYQLSPPPKQKIQALEHTSGCDL